MARRQPVELKDRFAISRRGWTIVAATTLAAAVVSIAIVVPIEPIYRTSAIIGADPTAQTSNDRVDFVADVRAAVLQRSVLDSVSNEVDVPRGVLEDSISVRRVNDSNLLLITYDTDNADPETTSQIVTLLPTRALEFLKSGQVQSAENAVNRVQSELTETITRARAADQAVAAAIRESNFVPPDVAFGSLQERLAELQLELTTIEPTDPDRAPVEALIEQLRSEVQAAADASESYVELVETRDQLEQRRSELESELSDARGALQASRIVPAITLQLVSQERSTLRAAMVQVFVVIVIAFLGSLLAVSAWERRQSSRGRLPRPTNRDQLPTPTKRERAQLPTPTRRAQSQPPTPTKRR
jgi:hypothetical protein